MDGIVAISTLFPRIGSAAGTEHTGTAGVPIVVGATGTGTAVATVPMR